MVPAGQPTYDTVDALAELLEPGDVIVDGGNSRYTDDQRHSADLEPKGIGFVDAGVSGGVWGLTEGYALMVGGGASDVAKVQPFFDTLKPEGEHGFVHAGEVGAGHFAKMVHNGIEYGLMQAYAEGWELLEATDVVTDVPAVITSWQRGHGHPLLAARPDGQRAARGRPPGAAARLRPGLRRGPLDRAGGRRPRRAAAGHHGRAVRPLRLAPGRQPGHEGGRRAAQPVRRARGDRGRRLPRRAPTPPVPTRRARATRPTAPGSARRARRPAEPRCPTDREEPTCGSRTCR